MTSKVIVDATYEDAIQGWLEVWEEIEQERARRV